MASSRPDKLYPTKETLFIAIELKDYKKFKEVFKSDKVYKFYVNDRRVIGREVIFITRSMRVNEFVDMLDLNKIKWRDLKPGDIRWI
jgi:hypothetical protein